MHLATLSRKKIRSMPRGNKTKGRKEGDRDEK